ncbi:MAG: RNA 3'-terminal phosphate cyclase [Ardenticatenaceae bacterium]
MSRVVLDGGMFKDVDTYLLGALALAATTGTAFEMEGVGRIAGKVGVTPLHLTALRALATLCDAEVTGDAVSAKYVRFAPTRPPRAQELTIDMGAVTGRPSPEPVTPLIEALIPALVRAGEETLIRLRGVNASPHAPSAFWLRETLAPMLPWAGINVAVEIERWGWYPDGGGETTLLVEGDWTGESQGALTWQERGDAVGLWSLAALSPRMDKRIGQQMVVALEKALGQEPIRSFEIEVAHVRSPGPGSGLFLAFQFEHVAAGFEAISYRGMPPSQVVTDAVAAMSHYFWSDAAFEPELARAMMIPLAFAGQAANYTTSELTPAMTVLEFLIPHFLPVTVTVSSHPAGGRIVISPVSLAEM